MKKVLLGLAALSLASCAHQPSPSAAAPGELVNVFDQEGRIAAAFNLRTSEVTLYQSSDAAARALFVALIRQAQQGQKPAPAPVVEKKEEKKKPAAKATKPKKDDVDGVEYKQ